MIDFTRTRHFWLTAVSLAWLADPGSRVDAQNPTPLAPCRCCASCKCQARPANGNGAAPKDIIHIECTCCGGQTAGGAALAPGFSLLAAVVQLQNRWLERREQQLKEKCRLANEQLEKNRGEVQDLKGRLSQLNADLTVISGERDLLAERQGGLNDELKQLRADLKDSRKEVLKLTDLYQASQNKLVRTEGEVNTSKLIIVQKGEKIDEWARKFEAQKSELDATVIDRDSLKVQLKSELDKQKTKEPKEPEEPTFLGYGRIGITIASYLFFLALAIVTGRICRGLIVVSEEHGLFESSWAGFGGGVSCWKMSRLGIAIIVMLISVGVLVTFTQSVLQATDPLRVELRDKSNSKDGGMEKK